MNRNNTLSKVLRDLIAAFCLATVCAGTALQTHAATPEIDYAKELSQARLFLQPLIWVGTNAPDLDESHELYLDAGLDTENPPTDRLNSMEAFINAHPHSPWVPSLCANLARFYRSQGRYSAALEAWKRAWDDTEKLTDPNGRRVADYALAYWTELLSSLGRVDELRQLTSAVGNRAMSVPEFQKQFDKACKAAAIMTSQPGGSFRCGSLALFHVAMALGEKEDFSALEKIPSPATGFSLAQLVALSDKYHLGLTAVKRLSGDELVVPSVIHWKEDHYAAIVEKRGIGYKVIDPTFGKPLWLSVGAINENASGYFLVPTNKVPRDWERLSTNQTQTVFGKGLNNTGEPNPSGPRCDANGNPCQTGACTNDCPPGEAGSGGNGSGPGGGGGGCAKCGGRTDGNGNPTLTGGMPDWEVQEPYISLWLHDRPMFYNMNIGRQFVLQMDYHQRETRPYQSGIVNFGPDWNCNLLTYIQIDGTVTNGTVNTTNCDWTGTNCTIDSEPFVIGELTATEFSPDGGQQVFAWAGTNVYTTINPRTHIQFVPFDIYDPWQTNSLPTTSTIQRAEHYASNTLVYPNGSVATFDFVQTVSTFPEEKIAFLTSATDPQGHVMTYSYITPGGRTQLGQVVDFGGNTLSFLYTNSSFPASVTQITNSAYGLAVNFIYDGNGFLTNIIDAGGISSSFAYTNLSDPYYTGYDSSGHPANQDMSGNYTVPPIYSSVWLLSRMTTPYGSTVFDYFRPTWPLWGDTPYAWENYNNINRALTVTQPDGGKQLFVYADSEHNFVQVPISPGTIPGGACFGNDAAVDASGQAMVNDGANDSHSANSFYWGPRQYAALSTTSLTNLSTDDYDYLARKRNWLHDTPDNNTAVCQVLNVEQGIRGLGTIPGQSIWYGYEGKVYGVLFGQGPDYKSTNDDLPVDIGIITHDSQDTVGGQSAYYIKNITRNALGLPVREVESGVTTVTCDEIIRTNYYIRAANGIDMIEHIDPYGATELYSYDGNHNVTAMTNALGEITRYTYNANGQVTGITYPNGLITTNLYGVDGFLATTYNYSGSTYLRTNTYTYANGLAVTHTDERGLAVTNSWDALQRLTKVAYPDGTSITYVYSNLDLVRVIDRMVFTNSYAYDSMRRKIAETNALGNATLYTYCNCGSLDSIQDALGNVTHFYYNLAGQLTNTTYPDGFTVTNQYTLSGKLYNSYDSSGNGVIKFYDPFNRLVGITNTVGGVAAYAYDLNDLVITQSDANGVSLNLTYDKLHRIRTRTYPDSGVEKFGYTANISGITSYTNQLNNIWTYAYDLLSRKTNEIAVAVYTNSFAYSPAGDLLTLTDGKNQNTTWKYDPFGRVTNKLDNLGTNLFVYQYDTDNRLTSRTSAAKGTTAYSYDKVGNLTLVNYPVSPDITLQYDVLNRLTNMVDAVGATRYAYDAVGQLLSEDGPWDNDTVNYTYANRLRTGLSVLAPLSSPWVQSYAYDGMRRLTNVTSPAGAFGYNYEPGIYEEGLLFPAASQFFNVNSIASSLVQTLILPNGAYITNNYDSVSRMTSTYLVNSGGTNLDTEDYVYNLGGQRTQQVFTAGNYLNYSYDSIGELTKALGKEPGGVTNRMQEQFGYVYDAAGNLNYRTNNALLEQFNVNSLNELTTGTNGGRLTVAGATTSPATNVTVNTSNAILYVDTTFASTNQPWVSGNNTYTAIAKDSHGRTDSSSITADLEGTNNYAYDLNGNMLTNGTRVFEYDDENQLIRITQSSTWKSEFSYDGKMRRRIRKEYAWNGSSWLQTNEVHYVYDDNLVIQERDGNNLPQIAYTRGWDLSGSLEGSGGIGGLLARTDIGFWSIGSRTAHTFYHADGNGNITALIFTNQSIAGKYEYDSYGSILSKIGILADVNIYRFSSKEYQIVSGTVHYLYRYYDPYLQKWVSADPRTEVGFENLRYEGGLMLIKFRPEKEYAYCGNSPINFHDPLGLEIDRDGYKKCMDDCNQKFRNRECKAVIPAAGVFGGAGGIVGGVLATGGSGGNIGVGIVGGIVIGAANGAATGILGTGANEVGFFFCASKCANTYLDTTENPGWP